MSEPYDLQRFVDAQNPVYEKVHAELREGRKRKPLDVVHLPPNRRPRLQPLGPQICNFFAIGSRGFSGASDPRSAACRIYETGKSRRGRPIEQIFGYPDDLKFRSSMTLFAHATTDNQLFLDALGKYFAGEFDPATLMRLPRRGPPGSPTATEPRPD